jgi:hypothetical protein
MATILYTLILPGLLLVGIVLLQRFMFRKQFRAQQEILNRYKESLAMQREGAELQRESVRLLGIIATAVERPVNAVTDGSR